MQATGGNNADGRIAKEDFKFAAMKELPPAISNMLGTNEKKIKDVAENPVSM